MARSTKKASTKAGKSSASKAGDVTGTGGELHQAPRVRMDQVAGCHPPPPQINSAGKQVVQDIVTGRNL